MNRRKLHIALAIISLCICNASFSQEKVSFTYSPISIGVIGGMNISFLPKDSLESKPAAIPFGGINIMYSPTEKFHTRLDIAQSTNGKNIISPSTKIRNLY